MSERKTSWFAHWGFAVVLAGAAAAAFAGWGTRAELWSFGVGFRILAWAVVSAALGGLLCLIGMWGTRHGKKRGRWRATIGFLTGLAVVGFPAMYLAKARSLPAIHDITTDPDNPPAFSAVAPLRRGSPAS